MTSKAAHVLTERQKKGALASVKNKQPRNVLVSNVAEYWPCLDEKQSENFVKLLETFCDASDHLSHLSIGLESSLRKLKKPNEVKILVIANEISPKWFAKHLIAMALHNTPSTQVVIIPKLKDITKKLVKVASIILCVRSTANSSLLGEFYNQLGIHQELLKHYCTVQPTTDVSIKKKKVVKALIESQVVLLKKPSDSSRAFAPMDVEDSSPAQSPVQSPISQSSDFISLSNFTVSSSLIATSFAPAPYRPIKIKKMIGNPNRKKK